MVTTLLVASCTGEAGTKQLPPAHTIDVCENDPYGCVEIPPGQPLRLGVISLIEGWSGPAADLGIDFALARRGVVRGHRVEIVYDMDACAEEQGAVIRGGSSKVGGPSIVAVVGPTCSRSAETAVPVLAERGITVISPNATGAEPTRGRPFFLRTAYNNEIQGDAMADFALERLGVKSAATLWIDYPYSERLERTFSERFAAGGGLLELRRQIPFGSTRKVSPDYRRAIQEIRLRRPSFVFMSLFGLEAAPVARLIREAEGLEDVPIGGGDAIHSIDFDFLHAAGDAAEGVLVTFPKPRVAKWFRRGLKRWARQHGGLSEAPLQWWPATAFDATNLVLDAVDAVGIQRGGTLFVPRTQLRDALRSTTGYRGVSGILTCNADGDCNPHVPVVIKEVSDGRFLPVWTWVPPS